MVAELVQPAALRDAVGASEDTFDESRAREAIEEVESLAVVYAGGRDTVNDLGDDEFEALRQVIKRFAKRVYSNPEGVLQRRVDQVGSVSYADTSESTHGLTRDLRRAVRAAVRASSVRTPHYASEVHEDDAYWRWVLW